MPVWLVLGAVLLWLVLLVVFYLAYRAIVPQGMLPENQWQEYWRAFPYGMNSLNEIDWRKGGALG